MIELLDIGVECPGPAGGRWHYDVVVDGHRWKKGDRFYVIDRHGAPRPITFLYHYTGNDSTVCYSPRRFRGNHGSIPCGMVTMVPAEIAVAMSDEEIATRGLVSDLLDAGEEHAALALLEVLEGGDPDDLTTAIGHAVSVLDAALNDGVDT